MRRSTWDSSPACPTLHCSTLTLEGTTVFQGPSGTSGIQHQPLQKHDAVCSSPHAPAQNGSSFRASSSGKVSNAAVWEALDMSPMSAVSCGRPSQDCQLSDLSQGISAHVAAWQKQHSMSMSACPTSSRRAPEGLPLSGRQPSARGRSSAGSVPRQTGMAGDLAPHNKGANWDSHKWLAFTPPASLNSARLSRRVSQGLPGGAGKLTQPDDSALRLPPLTPPGAEASNPAAPSSLPEASVAPLACGSAHPTRRRSAGPLGLGLPAGALTPGTADAQLNTLSASLCDQEASVQHGKGLNSAQPEVHAAANAAGDQLSSSSGRVCSQHEQGKNNSVAMVVHAQEQQQLTGTTRGVSPSVQQPEQQRHASTAGVQQQQQRHASTAGDDTGQLGPPITRMRPAPSPPSSSPGGKKSFAKQPAAADSAEAVLFDTLLCGWEQETNDGDLYPLTDALEKEGPEGADLQKLQLAAHMQLASRLIGPSVPPRSPSRTKAGKARPLRVWRQE